MGINVLSGMSLLQSHMFHSFAEMYQMAFLAMNVDMKRKFI